MSRPKREPRHVTVAEIAQQLELASYWFGEKWCPAVRKTSTGYAIRILKSQSISGSNQHIVYDEFDLLPDGTIDTAPRGHAKDWKPGRVIDIEAAAARYATPDESAMRLRIGGAR